MGMKKPEKKCDIVMNQKARFWCHRPCSKRDTCEWGRYTQSLNRMNKNLFKGDKK